MTDLAADYLGDDRQEGVIVSVKLAAIETYKGSLLTFNSSGYADQADADEPFAGMVLEAVDNSGGSAGDKEVRVWRSGVVTVPKASATQADVGKNAFIADDHSVNVTSASGHVPIGQVVGLVDGSNVRVHLNPVATSIVVDTQ